MGKLKIFLAVCLCLFSIGAKAYDFVQFNTDHKTIGMVEANTFTITASMLAQNAIVDSIKNKQLTVEVIQAGMLAILEGLKEANQNVSEFKKSSSYFKQINRTAYNIAQHSIEATELINKSKLVGKANALIKVGSLVTDVIALGNTFVNVVANAKVEHPMKGFASSDLVSNKGDGFNFLNRYERMMLYNKILSQLKRIDFQLLCIAWTAKTSTFRDLVMQLEPTAYGKLINMKWTSQHLVDKWNGLKKK